MNMDIYVTYEPCIIIYSNLGKCMKSTNYSRNLKNNLTEQSIDTIKVKTSYRN